MSQAILDAAILQVLSDREELATEKYVMLALFVEFRLKPTYTEIRKSLKLHEEKENTVSVRSDCGSVLWGITDVGRAQTMI